MTGCIKRPDIRFGAILLLCTWILFMAHYCMTGQYSGAKKIAICATLLDSLMISLPYFFVSRRWRKSVWIPLPLISVLFEINVLYYRNFRGLPGLSALQSGATFNSFTFAGAAAAFRATDLAAIFGPLAIAAAVWLLLKGRRICSRKFPRGIIIGSSILWITIPSARILLTTCHFYYWTQASETRSKNEYFKEQIGSLKYMESNLAALNQFGLMPYLWNTIASAFSKTRALTTDEIHEIDEFLSERHQAYPIEANRGKNLILIITESLNSTALNRGATPFLDSLITTESTLTAPYLTSQVGEGRSSDGQFMFNTGLLPLTGEALIAHYATMDYPSLPKLLDGYSSAEIIGEDSRMWNHNLTSRSYGYGTLVENVAPSGLDQDMRIFSVGAAMADSMPEPFLLEITSITMHDPYVRPRTSQTLDSITDDRAHNYLSATAHFDSSLRQLISELKSSGRYDRTVIAIVGDHSAYEQALPPDLVCNTVPMVVINAGISRIINQRANQIDVFPTLLDIMGNSHGYRGVGQSLLGPEAPGKTPAKAWRVSELLIRSRKAGNFWRNYNKGEEGCVNQM